MITKSEHDELRKLFVDHAAEAREVRRAALQEQRAARAARLALATMERRPAILATIPAGPIRQQVKDALAEVARVTKRARSRSKNEVAREMGQKQERI